MSPAKRQTVAHRHAIGKAHMAQVLGWWLGRSSLSYAQLSALAGWATGEPGILISSQITHIRKARLTNVNWRIIEALTEANVAIWRWHSSGSDACFRVYGPFGSNLLSTDLLDGCTWLPSPDEPDQPLNFEEWCLIFAGRLNLPYVGTIVEVPRADAVLLNQQLSQLINDQLARLRLPPRDAIRTLLDAYPGSEPNDRARLQGLILGTDTLTADELEQQLPAIATAIGTLRQQSCSALDLYSELVADRKRI